MKEKKELLEKLKDLKSKLDEARGNCRKTRKRI